MNVRLNNTDFVIQDFIKKTPITIFNSNKHISVCMFLAGLTYAEGSEDFLLYVNCLSKKSALARYLTALLYLLENKLITIESSQCIYFNQKFCNHFALPINCSVKDYQLPISFLNTSFKKKAVFKFMAHFLYRLFSRKKYRSTTIVKSYVEVSLRLFKKQYDDGAEIVLFPFALGIKRQINFYKLINNVYKKQISFDGKNYGLFDLIRLLMSNKQFDFAIIQFEKNAYRNYAKRVLKKGITTFYTTDDFEEAAFVLYSTLMQNGVKTINYAHGVNQSCPNVQYNEFHVLTSPQLDFYKYWNSQIIYKFQQLSIEQKQYGNIPIQIVFLESNLKARFEFEFLVQQKIIQFLQQLTDKMKVPFYVKLHPNSPMPDAAYLADWGIKYGYQLDTETYKPLIVTFFSTSYYTMSGLGPFISVTSDTFDVNLVLGDGIEIYSYTSQPAEIENRLRFLVQDNNYKQYHTQQVNNLNNR